MPIPIDGLLDLGGLQLPNANAAPAGDLGQQEFFELMLTQLKNQDPFKPLESGEFLSQIAQFSSVQSLGELNSSFASLSSSIVSNQALQGAALVGRSVLAPTDVGTLGQNGEVTGAVELDSSTTALRIRVQDSSGQIVREIDLGAQPAGLNRFRWGGETDFGVPATPGAYTITAQYFDSTGMQSAPVLVNSLVNSVSVGPRGLSVHLDSGREVPFDSVREIG